MLLDSFKVLHTDSEEISEIAEDILSNPIRHLDDIRVIVFQDVTSPHKADSHFDHPSHIELGNKRYYIR